MTRAGLIRVLKRLGLARRIASEDVHGIILRREGSPPGLGPSIVWSNFRQERWRLQCGGGIAGNGGVWWLEEIAPARRTVGPMPNTKEAERLLRQWKKWNE